MFKTQTSKNPWLIWAGIFALVAVVAFIAYFAQTGRWFRGAFLPANEVTGGPFYYVNDVTEGCINGGTADCPFLTIGGAVDYVNSVPEIRNPELRIAQGTYDEDELYEFTSDELNYLHIIGGYNEDFTDNKPNQYRSKVNCSFKASNVGGSIRGLRVENTTYIDQPFIEIDNSPYEGTIDLIFTISDLVAVNVNSSDSFIKLIGDDFTKAKFTVEDNYISAVSVSSGSIVDLEGDSNSIVQRNTISLSKGDPGIIFFDVNAKIINNVIVKSAAGNKTIISIGEGDHGLIANNTFEDNTTDAVAINQPGGVGVMVYNNIIHNSSSFAFNAPSFTLQLTIKNSIIGNYVSNLHQYDEFNPDCNPDYVTQADYRTAKYYKLGDNTTCKDKGYGGSYIQDDVTEDFFGTTRPQGSAYDIGAHEVFQIAPIGIIQGQLGYIASCGNSTVDTGEQCDDGNTNDNDACKNNCTNNICGDGVIRSGVEECDDGNNVNGDGCSSSCEIEGPAPACGDGNVDAGEQCDDGNTDDNDACKNDCTDNTCGDGVIRSGVEECDDGNTDDGDGCDASCEIEAAAPVCGDGNVDAGEECDDGNNADDDACKNDCTDNVCGDGVIHSGVEECDDGNINDDDGCDWTCKIEAPAPECGDGDLDAGEECDDGNNDSGDGCSSNCHTEEEAPPTIQVVFEEEEKTVECGQWTDIDENHRLYDEAVALCELDIFYGYGDGRAALENPVNRAETAAFLYRASLLFELDPDAEGCSPDVSGWSEKYICSAYDEKIVEGYPDGLYRPLNTVTLAEFTKIMLGGFDISYVLTTDPWFSDVLDIAREENLLPLAGPDLTIGLHEMTRGEVVDELYRFYYYFEFEELEEVM